MSSVRPRVAVVVAADFASGLAALAQQGPVWVIDTPANRAAVERMRAETPGRDVTLFTAPAGSSAEAACAEVLGMVELHHGPYSRHPPCATVEVFGASASMDVRAALAAEGYAVTVEREGGFVATRTDA